MFDEVCLELHGHRACAAPRKLLQPFRLQDPSKFQQYNYVVMFVIAVYTIQ